MIGIYCWTNLINNKKYIGQATDIERRKKQHINQAGKLTTKLSRALGKYGLNNFDFQILEECLADQLNQREHYWIHYYNTLKDEFGYNIIDVDENGCIVNGQHNPNTHLVDAEVIEIRHRLHILHQSLNEVYSDYADRVSYDSFWQLAHGVTWTHLDTSMIGSLINNHGENNPRTKLNNEDVLIIRNRIHINGESQLNVYQDYKDRISFDAFTKIVSGETWKNVDCSMIKKLTVQRKGLPKAKLTKEDVIRIRYEYEKELKTLEELKKEFPNVTPTTIRRVVNYETWKNI